MQERKLHIETPLIIGYLHHAYYLTVAREHPQFLEWLNCNYIQFTAKVQDYEGLWPDKKVSQCLDEIQSNEVKVLEDLLDSL